MAPEEEIMTAAWDCTLGSDAAFSAITEWRIGRILEFSTKDEAVGGSLVVVPMASEDVGGLLGNSERR